MDWREKYINKLICGDNQVLTKELPDECTDLLMTDPQYGWGFMGKQWDKALPSVDLWKECLRVLKPGAFAFIMSGPRQDCLARNIINLENAGFETGFTSTYWTYASGFPKAGNISKMVDKRLGAEREVIADNPNDREARQNNLADYGLQGGVGNGKITLPASPEAKSLDGSYAGFQPKPAVEVILVAMKPLSEKTYVEQALENGKGITWLDDGRIPYESEDAQKVLRCNSVGSGRFKENTGQHFGSYENKKYDPSQGRFPANLLVSDDVLNDGETWNKGGSINNAGPRRNKVYGSDKRNRGDWIAYKDSGSFSRYFSLDAWWNERIKQLPESGQKTFPFLIVPKASKREKNEGCEELNDETHWDAASPRTDKNAIGCNNPRNRSGIARKGNNHPTCKPLKLMSYLITLGSREGDIVLDPFLGSGTTAVAAIMLNRQFIGMELSEEYCKIAEARIAKARQQLKLALD